MSSTAMHRSATSYQARAGRALEEHTKAMIVAAAEQVMMDRITTPRPGSSIERLTLADVCGSARGYIRRDGTEGPIPKATMWKHFKTFEALAAAVIENLTADNRPVPEQIAALATRGHHAGTRRDGVDAQRLEARFSARHYDIPRLEEQFDHASTRNERSDMLFWAAELAERHLQHRRRGDQQPVVAARDWARRGIALVDPATRLDCMMGIRCTRAAAAAEMTLCRKPDYEPTGLSRIRSIKETEMTFADALGWQLHHELARFHAEHARALGEEDPDREMRSHHMIATTLIELCGPAPSIAREPQDTLRANELADVIVGLRRIHMAYATHPEQQKPYATIFGANMADWTRKLLACFPSTTSERYRHEGNIRALLRLDDLTSRFNRSDPTAEFDRIGSTVEDYEQAAIDLLRTAEYGTIRDILVARYLTAKARSLAQLDREANQPAKRADADRTDHSLVHPSPAALIQAAIQFYDHTAAASPRGAGGILRTMAANASAELKRANPPRGATSTAPTPPISEFDTIAKAINDLVLITISRRNRFTDNEIEHLIDMIDPMYYYITSGRN
ncbi:hypothetical protein [Nocardia lijiangensis]|uniref:hypothetical protein n=1 Tax=Nocardia lijiangensis TaxID=299618 RepID=UPI003D746BA2